MNVDPVALVVAVELGIPTGMGLAAWLLPHHPAGRFCRRVLRECARMVNGMALAFEDGLTVLAGRRPPRRVQPIPTDPYGVSTIAGARAAYVRGDIEIDEFERRVDLFLSGKPIAVLQPGERVLQPFRRTPC